MVTSNLQSRSIQQSTKVIQQVDHLSTESNTEPSVNLGRNNIGAFYQDAVIFMTGATGFVGKALLEKLLRSCTGISTIYVLIRPKRGQGIEQRLKELIKNPLFDRIREKTPEYFDKIKVVAGDVSQPNIGINETDRHILTSSVTIAFHSAATVRFNENLRDAVILNTLGTKHVLKLCKEMRKLKSLVHVSTAYSNADKKDIDEIVYPPPYNPKSIIDCVQTLPLETLNLLSEKLLGKHPNTYTITKAMAEHIVLETSSELPVAIVRPSIVTAAWKEPFPGWVDNVSGITGIMMEIGRGTIRSIICEELYIIDVIPVDVVANTLLTAAWHNATNRTNTLRVYNCTSGQVNGITWHNFGQLTLHHAIENPSKYTTWYPGFKFRTNTFIHWLCHWLLHVIPAFILDIFLYCTKHKPIMLRFCKKFAQAAKNGTFFAVNEWNFSNKSLTQLVEAVKNAEDGGNFNLDMSKNSDFDWDSYVKNYMIGIRKYVLKDDENTLMAARNKLKRLYWTKNMIQLVSLYTLLRFSLG